tara:strand:+ start:640 stop:831 length:192 start_codon:yes stop_codon:yes gene_type:complete
MLHTLEELIKKINTMHDMAVLLHRERYKNHDGSFDKSKCKHDLETIQAMAGDIFNDREGDEIN